VGQEIFGLGDDLLPWLLLAFGAALVAGNALALIRPPRPRAGELDDTPERPPLSRSLTMIVLGAVASVWAIASLVR
jgi:hypothetical protein